jgi:hypothetical protein
LIESNGDRVLIFTSDLADETNDVVAELLLFVEPDVRNLQAQDEVENCSVMDL